MFIGQLDDFKCNIYAKCEILKIVIEFSRYEIVIEFGRYESKEYHTINSYIHLREVLQELK